MPFNIGAPELIIIMVIILIIFGVGRLPEVGGAIGKGLREFRRAQKEEPGESASSQNPAEGKQDQKHT